MDGSTPVATDLTVQPALKKRAHSAGEALFDKAWGLAEVTREIPEYDFVELAEELFGHEDGYSEQLAATLESGFLDSLENNGWPRTARFAV